MDYTPAYKGYIGSIEFSEPDGLFYGKVQGIRSVLLYERKTLPDLIKDFHEAVNDYLSTCENKDTRTYEYPTEN